jgi:hypothetical protein
VGKGNLGGFGAYGENAPVSISCDIKNTNEFETQMSFSGFLFLVVGYQKSAR